MTHLQAPFPWFGGKSRVAPLVWERLGDPPNFVEPFFGSGAVLLGRPHECPRTETVNDKDGFVANFWRAVKHDPEQVAEYAVDLQSENDLHARHAWLVKRREDLVARLEGDPEYYDAKIAGWWCWGICLWIGGGFCSGAGPWRSIDGRLLREGNDGTGRGVNRQRPHLGDAGQGVNRKLPHLRNAGRGVNRQLPHLGDAGQGVNRQLPHLGDAGQGVNRQLPHLGNVTDWFLRLANRLARVRVCCGDWSRVCGPSPTWKHGLTGVFLDPPYSDAAGRDPDLYSQDCLRIAHEVRAWAIANGENDLMRIALCGYEGEHEMPGNWSVVAWKATGGYASQGNLNAHRERIWFSPACLRPERGRQLDLWEIGSSTRSD